MPVLTEASSISCSSLSIPNTSHYKWFISQYTTKQNTCLSSMCTDDWYICLSNFSTSYIVYSIILEFSNMHPSFLSTRYKCCIEKYMGILRYGSQCSLRNILVHMKAYVYCQNSWNWIKGKAWHLVTHWHNNMGWNMTRLEQVTLLAGLNASLI